jgi:hypothetical protein
MAPRAQPPLAASFLLSTRQTGIANLEDTSEIKSSTTSLPESHIHPLGLSRDREITASTRRIRVSTHTLSFFNSFPFHSFSATVHRTVKARRASSFSSRRASKDGRANSKRPLAFRGGLEHVSGGVDGRLHAPSSRRSPPPCLIPS